MKTLLLAVVVLTLAGRCAQRPIVVALDKTGDAAFADNVCKLRSAQQHRDEICSLVSPASEVEATFVET